MAKMLAYGEITFVDTTDEKQIQAYLSANQPSVVSYDPDASQEYTPDWTVNNLVLTPVIFIDNTQVSLTENGIGIDWQRKAGSGSTVDLVTGETAKDGTLVVSSNPLATISSGTITYICAITYTDPDTNMVAQTQCQMSFTLVKNAARNKSCAITGEQTFKYNGSRELISAQSIVLTANVTNTTIKQWQYKDENGIFSVYPNSTASTTLTVNATDDVFVNNLAVIKVITDDADVYDIHQIVKLYDGAAGNDTYTCVLSNDSQSVPCTANGDLYETSLTGCDTVITVYKGGTDDSANWTIIPTTSAGVSGTFDKNTRKYTVTGLTVDTGYVEFVCSQENHSSISKRFNINKDRSGADATFYQVTVDTPVLNLNTSNVFVPANVTFSASKRVGNATASSDYAGRFKVYESTNGADFTLKYTSSKDEYKTIYTPSAKNIKLIKAELYISGGTTTLLDTQSVTIVSDGAKGDKGATGEGGISVVIGNQYEGISCNPDGTVKADKDVLITFDCYIGLNRTAGEATIGTLPSGVKLKSNVAATESSVGQITLTFTKGATISSAESGDITITITSNKLTSTHKFTWGKVIQADSGENAVLLQIYAPSGDVIVNNSNNVILNTQLTDGTTVVTSGVTYQWGKYIDTGYADIEGKTNSSLTVTPEMVNSVASFRCKAIYNGKVYYAYWSVTDKSDPISINIFSTIGTTLVNGVGVGAAYALVFRNGEELDAIKTTNFIKDGTPSSQAEGDFYYKIDSKAKTVTLMKYSGDKWIEADGNDAPKGLYTWTRRNKLGEAMDSTTSYKTGKAIYMDADEIDQKMVFTCKFEYTDKEDLNVYIITDEVKRPVVDEKTNKITSKVREDK